MLTLPAAGTTPYKVILPSTTTPTGLTRTTRVRAAPTMVINPAPEAIHRLLSTRGRALTTPPVRPLRSGKIVPTSGKAPRRARHLADHQDQPPFRLPRRAA